MSTHKIERFQASDATEMGISWLPNVDRWGVDQGTDVQVYNGQTWLAHCRNLLVARNLVQAYLGDELDEAAHCAECGLHADDGHLIGCSVERDHCAACGAHDDGTQTVCECGERLADPLPADDDDQARTDQRIAEHETWLMTEGADHLFPHGAA